MGTYYLNAKYNTYVILQCTLLIFYMCSFNCTFVLVCFKRKSEISTSIIVIMKIIQYVFSFKFKVTYPYQRSICWFFRADMFFLSFMTERITFWWIELTFWCYLLRNRIKSFHKSDNLILIWSSKFVDHMSKLWTVSHLSFCWIEMSFFLIWFLDKFYNSKYLLCFFLKNRWKRFCTEEDFHKMGQQTSN